MYFRKRERIVRAICRDLTEFVRLRTEKLSPRRYVEEQVCDGDLCTTRVTLLSLGDNLAAGNFDRRTNRPFGLSFQKEAANRSDRGNSLTAKAESLDRKKILRLIQLAGGVPAKTRTRILGGHALTIVGHANQLPAPLF